MTSEQQETTSPAPAPHRGIALVFAFFGPLGAGQMYLGQRRRALLWFAIPFLLLVFCLLCMRALGEAIGYGTLCLAIPLGLLVAWVASVVDLYTIPAKRLRRASATSIVFFFVVGVVLLLTLQLLMRPFILEAFKIPSGAMQPSFLVGDHIFADKVAATTRSPKRGEVIVFRFPEHPEQDFIKRVIAIPGDTLEVKQGHPTINGWEVPYCLLGTASVPSSEGAPSSGELFLEHLEGESYLVFLDAANAHPDPDGPYTVAANEVWVLGDNRNNSHDSRYWFKGRGGGVPFDHVKARPLFRWLTVTNNGADWSRTGTSTRAPLLPSSMKSLEAALKKCLAEKPAMEKTIPPGKKP
jgi:signal peptidase I